MPTIEEARQAGSKQPFEIVSKRNGSGRQTEKNAKVYEEGGRCNLVDLFGHMIAALNTAGFLVYLKPVDRTIPDRRSFTIKQARAKCCDRKSEASSERSARILAKGSICAVPLGAQSRAGKMKKLG